MIEKTILAIARFLLRFVAGYHVHKDPVKAKKTTLPEPTGKEDFGA